MRKHQALIFCLFFAFSAQSMAQMIQWNQPEVVPEKLARANRRVLLLSGTAKPGTQIRIRDNKVKMYFPENRVRWARIPQKHRVQFPVIANEKGYFSFNLYLPTTGVEIPLEIFKGGKWVPYRFSFEVPQDGTAEDFKFIEDSYKVHDDEQNIKVEDFLGEYDKKQDQGLIVGDRDEWKSWVTGKVLFWGSLGLSYYSMTENPSFGPSPGTISGVGFPAFEIGGEYRWDPQWKVDLSYIGRMANIKSNGAYTLQNTNFNWSEVRGNLSYFPTKLESETARWGVLGSLRMQDLPYLKQTGPASYRLYTNSVTFVAVGGIYETMRKEGWNYDVTAAFLYPAIVGSEFKVNSGFGFQAGFSMLKEIIPALHLGGKVDANWMQFKTESHPPALSQAISADLKLWNITPSFLVKAEF